MAALINPRGWQAALQEELGVHHVEPQVDCTGCIRTNTCAALLAFAAGACAGYLGRAYTRQCMQAVEHAVEHVDKAVGTDDDCSTDDDRFHHQHTTLTAQSSDKPTDTVHELSSTSRPCSPAAGTSSHDDHHHRTDHPPSTPTTSIHPPDPSTPPVLSETHRRMALLVESLGINVHELSAGEKVHLLGVTVDLWNAMTSQHQHQLALRYGNYFMHVVPMCCCLRL